MLPAPQPAPVILNPDHSGEIRRLDCAHYNGCLERIDALKWEGFTCMGESPCGAYQRMSRDQARSDLDGIEELIRAIPKRYAIDPFERAKRQQKARLQHERLAIGRGVHEAAERRRLIVV